MGPTGSSFDAGWQRPVRPTTTYNRLHYGIRRYWAAFPFRLGSHNAALTGMSVRIPQCFLM